jgi:hypothetical protein
VPPETPSRATFDHEVRQLIEGFLKIRDEDVAICRTVQRGLASRFAERGQLSHLEKAIGQFARYLEARIGTGKARVHGSKAGPPSSASVSTKERATAVKTAVRGSGTSRGSMPS